MISVLALREKFDHMSDHSGYDALYQHLPPYATAESIFCNFKKKYSRGVGRVLLTASKIAGGSGFYNAQSIAAESKLLIRSAFRKYDVIHYTYGESYFALGGASAIKTPIVITNHQPVSWWERHESLLKKYKNAQKVITLSMHDSNYFNAHIPGKAICIPHGVDTEFYRPLAAKDNFGDKSFRVIFAGRYLRDTKTLAAVVQKLSASALKFSFDIVYFRKETVGEQYLTDLMALPNVSWYADIAEHRLLALYQQADCCLIPLEDCTANNVILEAMACGLPIISTNLPSIHTYLDDSMSILGNKENADDLCDALITLYKNDVLRESMSVSAREKAVTNFDWTIIACKTFSLFKSFNE